MRYIYLHVGVVLNYKNMYVFVFLKKRNDLPCNGLYVSIVCVRKIVQNVFLESKRL